MRLLNHTWSEAMHNMLAHQLTQYYQPWWVPSMAWTALVIWYTPCKPRCTKTLKNFWLTLILQNDISFSRKQCIFQMISNIFNHYIYIYIYIYKCCSKSSSFSPERKSVAEHFCGSNTLPLLLKQKETNLYFCLNFCAGEANTKMRGVWQI